MCVLEQIPFKVILTSISKATAPSKKVANKTASHDALKEKRAWDVAIAPLKSLPMQAFMLYMSGGGVQIFSIGIVFVLLLSPFRNLAAINEGFSLLAFLYICCSLAVPCKHSLNMHPRRLAIQNL